jgi:hypothetical protein
MTAWWSRTVPPYVLWRVPLPLRKKRSEPDPALAGLIFDAMRATFNGARSLVVKDHHELLQRLREDGVEFKVSDVYTVLGQMIADGRVERRPGIGMWLGNGSPTLWEPDITRVADIEGTSWGLGGWL